MNRGKSGNLDLLAAGTPSRKSLQGAMSVEHGKWFANRGQIIQVILGAVGLGIAAPKALADLTMSQYFSSGTVLFYVLISLVLVALARLTMEVQRSRKALDDDKPKEERPSDNPTRPGALIIHSAYYGAKNEYLEVTEIIRKYIHADRLDVRVSNSLFPRDPIFGIRKLLIVAYSLGDPRIRNAAQWEEQQLVIPQQENQNEITPVADLFLANEEIDTLKATTKVLEQKFESGDFLIKLAGTHALRNGRVFEPGSIIWRESQIQELSSMPNFSDRTAAGPEAIPLILRSVTDECARLRQELADCKAESSEKTKHLYEFEAARQETANELSRERIFML